MTRNRELEVKRCLVSLLAARPPGGVDVQVLVVDNNDKAVTGIDDLGLDATAISSVTVVHEPRPGVGHARARAIASSADSDWLLYFDDDQTATVDMLEQLFATQRAFDASVVSGVVLPRFSRTARRRVPRTLFERERRPTGSTMPAAGAGCLLLRRSLLGEDVSALLVHFNDGGEDTAITFYLSARGHPVVWADDALAYEDVEDSRLQWRWVLKRSTKHGRTLARYQHSYCGKSRTHLAVGGLGRLLSAAAGGLHPGQRHRTRMLARALRGVGYLQIALGRAEGGDDVRQSSGRRRR